MRHAILTAAILAVVTTAALAQDGAAAKQANRDREMLRRVQAAQRQAEEARAAAEQEKARVEGLLEEARTRAKAVESGVARERRRAGELQQRLDTLERDAVVLRQERDALSTRLESTQAELARSIAELDRRQTVIETRDREVLGLKQSVAEGTEANLVCQGNNRELATITREVLDKYRDVGVFDVLKRREPFTGVRRVQVDNLLEEYASRMEGARIERVR
jgi:chromosome segregation ATPase